MRIEYSNSCELRLRNRRGQEKYPRRVILGSVVSAAEEPRGGVLIGRAPRYDWRGEAATGILRRGPAYARLLLAC